MRIALAALVYLPSVAALYLPSTAHARTTRAAASTAMYRLHREPAPGAPPAAEGSSSRTRLRAVPAAVEGRASPLRFGAGLVGKLRGLLAHAASDVAELHSWRRMASTVFVAVLVVAWREGLRKGMATNPFQILLMGMCVVLELFHLAEPDKRALDQ